MDQSPLFSVLIANYNNGKYLAEAIESVKKQSYENWEIILVDDLSTDDSREVYKFYSTDTRIKVFYNEANQGCGFTKCRCTELVSGELMAFLDPDDVIHEDALKLTTEVHSANTKASIVYTDLQECDERLIPLNDFGVRERIPEGFSQINWKGKKISHFAAFKSRQYRQTPGIDPTLKRAVDQDLYYKLEEVGSAEYVAKKLYYYRNHSSGISADSNAWKAHYWHLVVLTNTYNRRKNQPKDKYPYNTTRQKLGYSWGNYFLFRTNEKLKEEKICKSFCFLVKSMPYVVYNGQYKTRFFLFLRIFVNLFRK